MRCPALPGSSGSNGWDQGAQVVLLTSNLTTPVSTFVGPRTFPSGRLFCLLRGALGLDERVVRIGLEQVDEQALGRRREEVVLLWFGLLADLGDRLGDAHLLVEEVTHRVGRGGGRGRQR